MNVRHPMGVLHSFSIKNIFYDTIDLRLFYFDVVILLDRHSDFGSSFHSYDQNFTIKQLTLFDSSNNENSRLYSKEP